MRATGVYETNLRQKYQRACNRKYLYVYLLSDHPSTRHKVELFLPTDLPTG